VVVLNRDGKKTIDVSERFIPPVRVVWPSLAESLTADQVRDACADTWAHALEGFLSPLADDRLRARFSRLIQKLLALKASPRSEWFAASAEASALQAKASVGLTHGIAHTLEGPLRAVHPSDGWGHARLCAAFLWPVMAFNANASGTFRERLREREVSEPGVVARLHELWAKAAYLRALPELERRWSAVLRDPCTRTNSVLVRPAHLQHFRDAQFQ
jgi:alcohol dehydrogenase class IV